MNIHSASGLDHTRQHKFHAPTFPSLVTAPIPAIHPFNISNSIHTVKFCTIIVISTPIPVIHTSNVSNSIYTVKSCTIVVVSKALWVSYVSQSSTFNSCGTQYIVRGSTVSTLLNPHDHAFVSVQLAGIQQLAFFIEC